MNFLKGKLKVNGSAVLRDRRRLRPARRRRAGHLGRPGAVYGVGPSSHYRDRRRRAEVVVVEPTGSETQVVASLGGASFVALFASATRSSPAIGSGSSPIPRWCTCSTRRPAHGCNA